jgi:hypothetical protein
MWHAWPRRPLLLLRLLLRLRLLRLLRHRHRLRLLLPGRRDRTWQRDRTSDLFP